MDPLNYGSVINNRFRILERLDSHGGRKLYRCQDLDDPDTYLTIEHFCHYSDQDFLPGSTIDSRYEIAGRIGLGPSGPLYHALDHAENSRPVAIGQIYEHDYNPDWFAEFISRPIAPTHNIPGIITPRRYAISSQGRYYMVLDCLGGPTLATLKAEQSHVFGSDELLEIFHSLATKLQEYHQLCGPFVHLNAKVVALLPDNSVQLIDPLHLRALYKEAPKALREGLCIASTDYTPPERFDASRHYPWGIPSDIWTFGVLAYITCFGRPPFYGHTLLDRADQIANKPLTVPWQDGLAQIPTIICACMEKSPDDRFQSMDEVATAIEMLAQNCAGPQVREVLQARAKHLPFSKPFRKFLVENRLYEPSIAESLFGGAVARVLGRKSPRSARGGTTN